MKTLLCIATLLLTYQFASGQWVKQPVNTTASFRGLSVVNEKVIWASGTEGTVIRTIDGGRTWDVMQIPGAEKLDFRDIEAHDAFTAYVLSIGNGDKSRVYITQSGDNLEMWKPFFVNRDERAFFDAIACWDRQSCVAMSDPVNDHFLLKQIEYRHMAGGTFGIAAKMPLAKQGEAAFAASGTCLITNRKDTLFLVSGGSHARVFKSDDRGLTWQVFETPLVHGTQGSGIFSIAMRDERNGVIVGGNYEKPNEAKDNLAFTADGGKTWKLRSGLTGYRSSVAYIDKKTIIAVGTNGSDISRDGGQTWLRIDGDNYNAVQAKGKIAIWAVGPKGYVAKLRWQDFLAINGYKPCPKNMICDAHANVDDLRLSHVEISSTCPQANSQCSNKRQIDIATLAPDVALNWYDYAVSGGHIIGMGANVKWDLADAKPGTYMITAGIKVPSANSFRVLGRTITKQVTVK